MEGVILWAGFIGGWLLFAGPIYQASVELGEVQIEREAIGAAFDGVEVARHRSRWWWLVPPVGYVLDRRQTNRYRKRAFESLDPEHQVQVVHYSQKASGWVYVGAGALFIASKETWELIEHHDWPTWLFGVLMVAMTGLGGLNTALRSQRSHAMLRGTTAPGQDR